MPLRWLAITCDAQRLLTKSQMWGKLWHATVQAGGWVGVRSGREKHLPGKTPQTAPPSQDLNVVNAATKVDPRAMAEPGSRYPEGDGPSQEHIFACAGSSYDGMRHRQQDGLHHVRHDGPF